MATLLIRIPLKADFSWSLLLFTIWQGAHDRIALVSYQLLVYASRLLMALTAMACVFGVSRKDGLKLFCILTIHDKNIAVPSAF